MIVTFLDFEVKEKKNLQNKTMILLEIRITSNLLNNSTKSQKAMAQSFIFLHKNDFQTNFFIQTTNQMCRQNKDILDMHLSFTCHVTFLVNLLKDVFFQKEGIKSRRERHGIQQNGTQHKRKIKEISRMIVMESPG